MNRAVELLAGAAGKARTPARGLGKHPVDGKPVTLSSGRFGPYVSHGGLNANLPRGRDTVELDEAVALLAAKAAKSGKAPVEAAKAKAAKAKTTKAKAAKPKAVKDKGK
jgi:DNA topoisomerase-1